MRKAAEGECDYWGISKVCPQRHDRHPGLWGPGGASQGSPLNRERGCHLSPKGSPTTGDAISQGMRKAGGGGTGLVRDRGHGLEQGHELQPISHMSPALFLMGPIS